LLNGIEVLTIIAMQSLLARQTALVIYKSMYKQVVPKIYKQNEIVNK